MASRSPIQASSSTNAPVRVLNPQHMQAQAGARLGMFLSDGTLNPFYNGHAVSGNDANHRGDGVAAAIDRVDRTFAGHSAGGGAGPNPARSDMNLRSVGAQFSNVK